MLTLADVQAHRAHEGEGVAALDDAVAEAVVEVQDAVLVPSVAVIAGLDEKTVFVVRDGKATRRPIEIGTRTATTVQVISGLSAGDLVVTSGLQQMREGLPVAVDEVAAEAQQTAASGKEGAEPT